VIQHLLLVGAQLLNCKENEGFYMLSIKPNVLYFFIFLEWCL